MATTIVNEAASAAWSAATSQQAQLEGLDAAFPGNVTLRYYSAAGTHLRTVTHGPWAINTATTPRQSAIGALIADTPVTPDTATYVIASTAPSGGTDILRADIAPMTIVTGSRPNLQPQTGAAGLVVQADAGLPAADVPVWVTSQTMNTWGAIPASNTLNDLNPDDDPLVNPNHPSAAPWRVTGGHDAIVRAWSGAAFDDVGGVLWWTDAGGHGDGLPNGVYKLDLNRSTPLYTRVRNPSGSVGMSAVSYDNLNPPFSLNYAEMEDERPRAHHTLNYPFYWPGVGPGLASEIIIAPSGGSPDTPSNRSRPAIYSPVTGERTTLGANKYNNASGGYDAACYDSVRPCVWKVPSGSGSSFIERWGGPSADSWTATTIQQYFSGPCSVAHSPSRDVILIGNGGNDLVPGGGAAAQSIVGGWGVIDPSGSGTLYAQGHTGTYPTFTGAPATAPNGFATGLWPGLTQPRWSERLGAFLAWHMSTGSTTQIMKITPPESGSLFTGTWTISYLTVSDSNAVTPSAAQPVGTFGRFFVWDEMGICGVVNSVEETGYFFRYA